MLHVTMILKHKKKSFEIKGNVEKEKKVKRVIYIVEEIFQIVKELSKYAT